MLLAPALLLLWRSVNSKKPTKNLILLAIVVTTLVLTLSRGAIYAFVAGAVVLLLTQLGQKRIKLLGLSVLTMIGACAIALVVQGWMASINPHLNVTFGETIAKSINQLTLGVVKIGLPKSSSHPTPALVPAGDKNTTYDGYVAESTNVRVNLSKVALATWYYGNPIDKLFGSGLGSAGIVMARYSGSSYQKEIVQNEFVEVLLERGVLGFILLLAMIISLLWQTRRKRWLWSMIVAYLTQWCFFSGLPNVLHMYLVVIALVVAVTSSGRLTPATFSLKEKE